MKTRSVLFPLLASLVLFGSGLGWAAEPDDKEQAELAQALNGAKVSLKQGLVASESKGKPISGKFEVEDRELHLSIYTAKGGAFSEVLVDPKSGRVAKDEAIETFLHFWGKGPADALARAVKSAMDTQAK